MGKIVGSRIGPAPLGAIELRSWPDERSQAETAACASWRRLKTDGGRFFDRVAQPPACFVRPFGVETFTDRSRRMDDPAATKSSSPIDP